MIFCHVTDNTHSLPHCTHYPLMRGHTSLHEATMGLLQRTTSAHFRRPVTVYNNLQIDITKDHRHHIFPRILEYHSGVNFYQHGLCCNPFCAEGAVCGYIIPPSGPHGANQPSHQAPPPHHMTALTTTMIMMDCRWLLASTTTPMAPTPPQTTMEEMGGFLTIFHC